ncbi:MAG: cupin domain-containing protein [Acidobacteriota bacterium]
MKYLIALTAFAASACLMAAEAPATHVEHDKISALFAAKGGPIAKGNDYSVAANKRTGPGKVEVHDKETDVFHIMDGEATLVTGGKMIDGKKTRPDQWLGESIDGGTTFKVSKGDVVVVPAGTPHWFKETNGISYYTVKVIKP